uniref:N-alpha-acetyltransferase 25, NatB auxiliary subunit n=1 Tax=Myripristis murdjan TaxID=586833 RepID=A0A667YVI4_9TELE
MAARGHVQDPNDRRLRPIYDYLDNGNNKMAIQQADKLLKKHKDLHCAKVLKAIGLQRTGKQDEAFTLAQEVATLEPTDDNSLQALTILYREMHRRKSGSAAIYAQTNNKMRSICLRKINK